MDDTASRAQLLHYLGLGLMSKDLCFIASSNFTFLNCENITLYQYIDKMFFK